MTAHLRNFDWSRAKREGAERAFDEARRGQEVGVRDVWWCLLCEAAWVARKSFSAPPRMGYPIKSVWPDMADDISRWAMAMAELQDATYDAPDKPADVQPSAAQVTRAGAVLEVWHLAALTDYGDKRRMKQAVWMKANGIKDRVVRAKTGLARQRIHDAKCKAMDDMAEFVLRLDKRTK